MKEIKHSLHEVSQKAPLETNLDYNISEVIQIMAGKTKKHIRDDQGSLDPEKRSEIIDALHQTYHYVNQKAQIHNSSLEEVCEKNIEKLFSRKDRGVLKGSGDNR